MKTNSIQYFTSHDQMLLYAKQHFLTLASYKGAVYDLTDFIYQHPGGHDTILDLANQPLDNVLFNQLFHKHSPHIIPKLQNYLYGYIKKVEEVNLVQHRSAK